MRQRSHPLHLVIGGGFQHAGGVFGNDFSVREWNGSGWTALGTSANGDIRSLLVLGNGDLIAGGAFVTIGGVSAVFIARWNGTAWSPLPGLQHSARALPTLPNTPALGGLQLHQQVVALALSPALALPAATSSNALRLTLGSL